MKRAYLHSAIGHLPEDLRLTPASFLAAPLTVGQLKEHVRQQIPLLDPDAHLWRCGEWQAWESGDLGELRFQGQVVFRFEPAHHGEPRHLP